MSGVNLFKEIFVQDSKDKKEAKKKSAHMFFILFIFGVIVSGINKSNWSSVAVSVIILIFLIIAFKKQKEKMNAQDLVEKYLPQNVHNKYKSEWNYKKLLQHSVQEEKKEKEISNGRVIILITGIIIWVIAFGIYLLFKFGK